MYTIDPKREHVILTPDGGMIECRHEAAANRVVAELNYRDTIIHQLRRYADVAHDLIGVAAVPAGVYPIDNERRNA